jgi:hypothetical protein
MTATVTMMNTKTTLAAAAAATAAQRRRWQCNGGGSAAVEAAAARQWQRQRRQPGGGGGSVAAAVRHAARQQRFVGSRIASAWVGGGGSMVTLWGGVFLQLRHFWQFGRPCITSENGRLLLKIKFPHERHTKNPVWYLNQYLFHHVCIFRQLSISCVNISTAT